MLIIFGQRWTTITFGQLEIPCPRCAKSTFHGAQLLKGKFTLFFVPIIPLHSRYQVVCNICGYKRKALGVLRAQLEGLQRSGQVPVGLALKPGEDPTCPRCGHIGPPNIEKRISKGQWAFSGCLFLSLVLLPFFWIPLLLSGLRDEICRCSACGQNLAAPAVPG